MKKLLIILMMFGSIYSQCLGDLNDDGIKDILDIVLLVNDILDGDDVCEEPSFCDDGEVDCTGMGICMLIFVNDNNYSGECIGCVGGVEAENAQLIIDLKEAILDIEAASMSFFQQYNSTPSGLEELVDEGFYEFPQSLAVMWEIEINIDYTYYGDVEWGEIVATSTAAMPGGEGQMMSYILGTGQFAGFSGYGICIEGHEVGE